MSTHEPTPAGSAVLDATRRRHRADRAAQRRFLIAARLGIVVVALAAWELASGTLIRSFYVSSPGAVA
jgi:sulfonate transport system permease protein